MCAGAKYIRDGIFAFEITRKEHEKLIRRERIAKTYGYLTYVHGVEFNAYICVEGIPRHESKRNYYRIFWDLNHNVEFVNIVTIPIHHAADRQVGRAWKLQITHANG